MPCSQPLFPLQIFSDLQGWFYCDEYRRPCELESWLLGTRWCDPMVGKVDTYEDQGNQLSWYIPVFGPYGNTENCIFARQNWGYDPHFCLSLFPFMQVHSAVSKWRSVCWPQFHLSQEPAFANVARTVWTENLIKELLVNHDSAASVC